MEDQNYQDEFEQFLQDEVKQHRMYPSDHIWKNIRTDIHGHRSWPALSFISLFIITTLTISTLLNNHPGQHISPATAPVRQHLVNQDESIVEPATDSRNRENYFTRLAPDQLTAATLAELEEQLPAFPPDRLSANAIIGTGLTDAALQIPDKTTPKQWVSQSAKTTNAYPAAIVSNTGTITEQPVTIAEPPLEAIAPISTATILGNTESDDKEHQLTADESLKNLAYAPQLTRHSKNPKFGIQFYITPSTSYRKLSDEKLKEIVQPATTAINAPLSQHSNADVNNVVRHKPAVGLEFGFAVLYNMTNRLKFKTGLQLNIRQYYIETFQSLTYDLTTISLINYRGIENINLYSPYNNNVGIRQTQLDNKLYQVSVPIGVEWDVLQGKHLGLNTEASIQPTFTLNKNVYLLSTDLKHYADGNNLLRKWNINTSVGVNLTYKLHNTTLLVGPQIRYQHLPSYSNLYPIKEYLLDYGVRVGLTKQLFK